MEILPRDIPLGLPINAEGPSELIEMADKVILDRFSMLKTRPQCNPNYVPMTSATYEDSEPTQPYPVVLMIGPWARAHGPGQAGFFPGPAL
jgi:hypothetical protein